MLLTRLAFWYLPNPRLPGVWVVLDPRWTQVPVEVSLRSSSPPPGLLRGKERRSRSCVRSGGKEPLQGLCSSGHGGGGCVKAAGTPRGSLAVKDLNP